MVSGKTPLLRSTGHVENVAGTVQDKKNNPLKDMV